MTYEDAVKWLGNLKNDIGNPHYECLWPYAQAIEEICELLKGQEAVEPDGENCGECGYTLHRINYDGPGKELRHEWFRFCPSCGKAVKWNG
jgi:ribosomal protein S27AE